MRLWHWKLIPVLPKQQLLGQWRECCLIMKNISENGTPNHILVNPIMDYPLDHFYCYAYMVNEEMQRRGYQSDWLKFTKWMKNGTFEQISGWRLFQEWHTRKYLMQCITNLEEKHDRGGITDHEWKQIIQIPELNRRYGMAV